MPKPQKILIVDGYNVLRHGSYYQEFRERMADYGDEAFNAAREALINDVAVFAGQEYRPLIVFDGGNNRYSEGQPAFIGNVEVVFSAGGVTADSVIEERSRQAAAQGREVLVVTSDATTQWTVMGGHVSRMSAAGFYDELHALAQESQSDLKVSEKSTLGERLPADVLAELKKRFG